jgi:hypothetical protein
MTLLTTIFAAVVATVIWYKNAPNSKMMFGTLSLVYWGASLMWLIDAVAEYIEVGAEYFEPDPLSMLNDLYLGLSAVALGLVIWIVILLVKDPKGSVRATLFKK